MVSTKINGVYLLENYPYIDARGEFMNLFPQNDSSFKNIWGDRRLSQVNLSKTSMIGCIRGLHMQAKPHCDAKIVRCLKGEVWDVVVDARRESNTFGSWYAAKLSPEARNSIIIPEGCAHGFQVLESDSELLYFHSSPWVTEADIGIRFDDPDIGIEWPLTPIHLSKRDQNLPMLRDL